jgi:hypothetical protein
MLKRRREGFRCIGEPSLDELLDDPMMHLLWRRDRLEPDTARAIVYALEVLMRWRQLGSEAGTRWEHEVGSGHWWLATVVPIKAAG